MFHILNLFVVSFGLFPYVNHPEQTQLNHFFAPEIQEEITSKIFTDVLRVNSHVCVIGSKNIDFMMCQKEDVHSSGKFGHMVGGMLDVCSAAKNILRYPKLGNATEVLLREIIRELHEVGPYLRPENSFQSSCDLSEEAKIQDYITYEEFCFWIIKFCSKMEGLHLYQIFSLESDKKIVDLTKRCDSLECMLDVVAMSDSQKAKRYKYDSWVTKISEQVIFHLILAGTQLSYL